MAGEIPVLEQHEINPGLDKSSRENYLYFFLPCALNFQRSSPALWQSALDTWNDEHTRYLFFPEQIVLADYEKIRTDLTKHNLALQTNKHPHIWHTIATTLHTQYQNDPRNLLREGHYKISEIRDIIQKEKAAVFPYLKGPKLSNYVLAIMSIFTDAKFDDIHELSIIPDTHIIKATAELGLTEGITNQSKVAQLWQPILHELQISPIEMHSALWNWSRNNFQPSLS